MVLSLIKVITCQEPSQNLHIMNVCMYLSSMSHGKSDFVCKHQTKNETMLKYGPTQNETMLKYDPTHNYTMLKYGKLMIK